MVVAMRLMRMGTTHRPIYRVSVADSRRAPTGKFIEHIGTYDPNPDKLGNKQLRLNVARAKYWIAMGCQPSTVVARLLSRFHLIPVPPQRNMVVTGPLLHKVLAGEDVRAFVPQPGENPATTLTTPVAHVQKSDRHLKALTPERIAQLKKQSPWKLQTFPFETAPTEKTMQAWQQARVHHKQVPFFNITEQAINDAKNWVDPEPEVDEDEAVVFEEVDDAEEGEENELVEEDDNESAVNERDISEEELDRLEEIEEMNQTGGDMEDHEEDEEEEEIKRAQQQLNNRKPNSRRK